MWRWLSPTRTGWAWGAFGWEDLRRLIMQRLAQRRREQPEKVSQEDELLLAVEVIRELGDAVDAELTAVVAEAREAGVSWDRIATKLGCSRQTAHERYSAILASPELGVALDDHVIVARHLAQSVAQTGRDTAPVSVRDAQRFMREQTKIDQAIPGGSQAYFANRSDLFSGWPNLTDRAKRAYGRRIEAHRR